MNAFFRNVVFPTKRTVKPNKSENNVFEHNFATLDDAIKAHGSIGQLAEKITGFKLLMGGETEGTFIITPDKGDSFLAPLHHLANNEVILARISQGEVVKMHKINLEAHFQSKLDNSNKLFDAKFKTMNKSEKKALISQVQDEIQKCSEQIAKLTAVALNEIKPVRVAIALERAEVEGLMFRYNQDHPLVKDPSVVMSNGERDLRYCMKFVTTRIVTEAMEADAKWDALVGDISQLKAKKQRLLKQVQAIKKTMSVTSRFF